LSRNTVIKGVVLGAEAPGAATSAVSGVPVRLLQPGSGRSQLTQPSPEISVGIAEVSGFA
jgi:hypothetical protein